MDGAGRDKSDKIKALPSSMNSSKILLSVVIPCYNEVANLKRDVLEEVATFLQKQPYLWEVIISDDGSNDQSVVFIKDFIKNHPGFRLIENLHQGKPFALRSGVEKANGQYTLITDMDQSTPLNQAEKLLPWFKKNYQIVIGSRGGDRLNFPLYRRLASAVFRAFRKSLILKELVDTQCGFKAFITEVGQKIFAKMTIFKNTARASGWRVTAYDVEFLFIAKKMGYQTKEVFIDWQDKNVGQKKLSSFLKESQEMAKEIIRVKINEMKGFYG